MFPVANFLKCVVTEVVLFSVVAFKPLDISQGSVATHLRCDRIFSDDIITYFLLLRTVNKFENRLIFRKVKAYKNGAIVWATLYVFSNAFLFVFIVDART